MKIDLLDAVALAKLKLFSIVERELQRHIYRSNKKHLAKILSASMYAQIKRRNSSCMRYEQWKQFVQNFVLQASQK